jgi:uroporphyrinogen decarboxylase
MMTPRENLLRTLRRQGFDWVPLDCHWLCPDQIAAFKKRFGDANVGDWFNVPIGEIGVASCQPFTAWRETYFRDEELPPDATFSGEGVGHSRPPGCFHMSRMHHPLRGDWVTADMLLNYPYPATPADALDKTKTAAAAIQAGGRAAVVVMACTLWETAWNMRSMEDLMADMMGDDDRATLLLDRVTAHAVDRANLAARAGADILHLGDDIGLQSTTMMSPELWRKWLKPRLANVISAARGAKPDILVFYHSCGFVVPFIDELIEIGVDILNPVQPECMSFADIHRRYGNRLSFWGTIGTQTTLPFGKPADVREAVCANLRACGEQGGLVIGPTHMVEPEVPWENLVAMKEACESFRL